MVYLDRHSLMCLLSLLNPGNLGVASTPAIVQDVIIVRDVAFSQAQVRQLLNRTRPPSALTSLVQMLPLVGAYSLDGLCIIPWEDDMYLMKQWDLCPSVVCGPICLDESFFLFPTVSELNRGSDMDESQEHDSYEEVNESPVGMDRLHRRRHSSSDEHGSHPDVEHTGGDKKRPRARDNDPTTTARKANAEGPSGSRVLRKDHRNHRSSIHASSIHAIDPSTDEYFDDDLYDDDEYLDYGPYTDEELDYLEAVYGSDYYDDGYGYMGEDGLEYAYEEGHENGMRIRPNDVRDEQVTKIGRMSSQRAAAKDGSSRRDDGRKQPVSSSKEQQQRHGIDKQHPSTKDATDAGGNNERGVNGKAQRNNNPSRSSRRVTLVKHSARMSIRLPRLSHTTPALASTGNHYTTSASTTSPIINESQNVNASILHNIVSLWIDPIKWAEQTLLLLPQLIEAPLTTTRRYVVSALQSIMTLFGAEVKPSLAPSTTTSTPNDIATEGITTTDTTTTTTTTTTTEQNNNNGTHNHTNPNYTIDDTQRGHDHFGSGEGHTWFPRSPSAQSAVLYDAAILWLNGRHEELHEALTVPFEIARAEAVEKAQAALVLSIWLADDVRLGEGFRWPFSTSSPVTHADHMVLAHLESYDRRMDVRIRPQAGQTNKSRGYFGGASLHQLLCTADRDHGKNTTRSVHIETDGQAVKNQGKDKEQDHQDANVMVEVEPSVASHHHPIGSNRHPLPIAAGKDASSGVGDGVGNQHTDGLLLAAVAEWEASLTGFDNRDLVTEWVELTKALELDSNDDETGSGVLDTVGGTASGDTNADRRQCVGEDGRMSSTCGASASYPRKESTPSLHSSAQAHPHHHHRHHHQHLHQHPPHRHLPQHHHANTKSSPHHPLRALVVAGVSPTIVAEVDGALRVRQSSAVRRDEIHDYHSQATILSKNEQAYVASLINELNDAPYAPSNHGTLTTSTSSLSQKSGYDRSNNEGFERSDNSNRCNSEETNVQDGQ